VAQHFGQSRILAQPIEVLQAISPSAFNTRKLSTYVASSKPRCRCFNDKFRLTLSGTPNDRAARTNSGIPA
jgi:hypothetical protein